ncbi:MAG: START domain-containing protein [Planctomycetota bacterium]|jgi:hypothetical protein
MIRRFFQGRQAIPPFLPYLVIFIATYVFSCIPLLAEEEEWRFVYGAEDIIVHKRVKAGSSFLEFKAIGDLRGNITEYMNLLLDTDKIPDWAPQCFEAKNVEIINENENIIYVACNGIWPVSDRDYIAKRTVITDPEMTTVRINVDLTNNTNLAISNNRIHIAHLQCYWILKKIDSAYTHVELYAFVDPGGWLPAWLVNWGYRWIPFRFLKNLETEVVERSGKSNIQFVTASTPPP